MSDDLKPAGKMIGLAEMAESAAREVAANRESYVKAWLAETGLLPSQCELVEQFTLEGVVVKVQRRRDLPG